VGGSVPWKIGASFVISRGVVWLGRVGFRRSGTLARDPLTLGACGAPSSALGVNHVASGRALNNGVQWLSGPYPRAGGFQIHPGTGVKPPGTADSDFRRQSGPGLLNWLLETSICVLANRLEPPMTAIPDFERWDFRQEDPGHWTWQRVNPNGSVSRPSHGTAILEAMESGFNPSIHQWMVEDRFSITRFAPGKPPAMLRK
jgi:hypothetical protein